MSRDRKRSGFTIYSGSFASSTGHSRNSKTNDAVDQRRRRRFGETSSSRTLCVFKSRALDRHRIRSTRRVRGIVIIIVIVVIRAGVHSSRPGTVARVSAVGWNARYIIISFVRRQRIAVVIVVHGGREICHAISHAT